MNIDAIACWSRVGAIVKEFAGIEAGTSYGTPAFKVNKKLFVRLKEDGQTIVVYNNEREKWMKQDPEVFFITDHYKDHPLVLIDSVKVKSKDLKTLLYTSWQIRAPKSLLRHLKK